MPMLLKGQVSLCSNTCSFQRLCVILWRNYLCTSSDLVLKMQLYNLPIKIIGFVLRNVAHFKAICGLLFPLINNQREDIRR